MEENKDVALWGKAGTFKMTLEDIQRRLPWDFYVAHGLDATRDEFIELLKKEHLVEKGKEDFVTYLCGRVRQELDTGYDNNATYRRLLSAIDMVIKKVGIDQMASKQTTILTLLVDSSGDYRVTEEHRDLPAAIDKVIRYFAPMTVPNSITIEWEADLLHYAVSLSIPNLGTPDIVDLFVKTFDLMAAAKYEKVLSFSFKMLGFLLSMCECQSFFRHPYSCYGAAHDMVFKDELMHENVHDYTHSVMDTCHKLLEIGDNMNQ
jgi:hypothetical protein